MAHLSMRRDHDSQQAHAGRFAVRTTHDRWIQRMVVAALGIGLLMALPAMPVDAQPAQRRTMTASAFVRQIQMSGIDTEHVDIAGTVDLRTLERVKHPVRCNDCAIDGSLLASDVTFERIVDLRGTRIAGSLDVHRAAFRAAFLFQELTRRPATVASTANFNLATFDANVGFDRTKFLGPFTAQDVSVAGTGSFVETEFWDATRFDRAVFDSIADFTGSAVRGDATFDRANFGTATFGQARFDGRATFVGANVQRRADFTGVEFNAGAQFDAATFGGTSTFRLVQSDELLSLTRVRAQGVVDFDAAELLGGLSLASLSGTDALSLRDATFDEDAELRMEPLQVPSLLMDLDDVERIAGSLARARALELLEQSAEGARDLGLANGARFELLSLRNNEQRLLPRLLDTVFYRTIGGYLVRPWHPLRALLLALVLAASVRAVQHLRLTPPPVVAGGTGLRDVLRASATWSHHAMTVWWHSLSVSVMQLPGIGRRTATTGAPVPDGQWTLQGRNVEAVAYRVLFVVLLISIGNASSTIREVIDAVVN